MCVIHTEVRGALQWWKRCRMKGWDLSGCLWTQGSLQGEATPDLRPKPTTTARAWCQAPRLPLLGLALGGVLALVQEEECAGSNAPVQRCNCFTTCSLSPNSRCLLWADRHARKTNLSILLAKRALGLAHQAHRHFRLLPGAKSWVPREKLFYSYACISKLGSLSTFPRVKCLCSSPLALLVYYLIFCVAFEEYSIPVS